MAKLAGVAVLRLPRPRGATHDVLRLLPSWRALAIAFAALLAIAGGYLSARQSSLFAVELVEIDGAPPLVEQGVRRALAPLEGESLLRVDRGSIESRLAALPSVEQASFDRAFPHTLRVTIEAERPVAVLRRGDEAWLVSARARVIRRLGRPRLSRLPRVWVPARVEAAAGDKLSDAEALRAVAALAAVASAHEPLPARVRYARASDRELTLVLVPGTKLQLGAPAEVELKLAVARRVLLTVGPNVNGWPAYVDLTVPERPVVGSVDSTVESET